MKPLKRAIKRRRVHPAAAAAAGAVVGAMATGLAAAKGIDLLRSGAAVVGSWAERKSG